MNSKFLNFLLVLACAALLGLGSLRAQNPASNSDGNGSAVSSPSRQSDNAPVAPASTPNANDAHRASTAAADSRNAANTAVANDRGTLPANQTSPSSFHIGWIGLVGLLGLLGLFGLLRRSRAHDARGAEDTVHEQQEPPREDYRRAA